MFNSPKTNQRFNQLEGGRPTFTDLLSPNTEDRGFNLDRVYFKSMKLGKEQTLQTIGRAYRRDLFGCQQLPINLIKCLIKDILK